MILPIDACIQTFTGGRFRPLDPKAADVDVRDIAHALSLKCRYGGHCDRFYSVAEHSVHVYRHVGTLEALMHDAGEAYSPFGDIPRPIKQYLPWAKEIDDKIDLVIAERFDLTYPWPEAVKAADTRIIADEKAAVFQSADEWAGYDNPIGAVISGWPAFWAERIFLQSFAEAVAGR